MKNLLFASIAILSLTGCGKKSTAKTEPEYTVTVEVDQPERFSGVMQDSSWNDEK